jgi:hypothetical protein
LPAPAAQTQGRGALPGQLLASPRDFSQHTFQPALHVLIGESNHSITALLQVGGTRFVIFDLLGVAVAVNFDHQSR